MKKSTKLFLALLLSCFATIGYTQGVKYETGSFNEILALAKKSGKMVMLNYYTDWCIPCKQMEKDVLSQERVGDAVNPSFVSLRVNAEEGEGIELAKRHKVGGYPTILFLNSDETEVVRVAGAFNNAGFFIKFVELAKGDSGNLEKTYNRFLNSTAEDKLSNAKQLALDGPLYYLLIKDPAKKKEVISTVNDAADYYFANKPVDQMINKQDFEILSMFLDGATNEKPQIQFLYKNYDQFKNVVPEADLARFVVKVNNQSIQDYSRRGDLLWKRFVGYIGKELADAYLFMGEKDAKGLMSGVANINAALYVDKNFDRYISLRDQYSKRLEKSGGDMQGNYLYAAQTLWRHTDGKLTPKQAQKGIEWLNKNIENGFNLPSSYLLLGDFYSVIPDKKVEAISNYNRCVLEAKKQGERVENRYTHIVRTKLAKMKAPKISQEKSRF